MKIKKITISGFMGIKDELTVRPEKITLLSSSNGTGKTSVLSAIRYALTGIKPAGEMINRESQSADVRMVIENASGETADFRRHSERDKTDSCYYEDNKITGKALNEMLERFTGLPLDKVKTVSSQDLVAAMKPKEFGKFILSYIPKKMTREDIKNFIPGITDGMSAVLDDDLPEDDIDIDSLDELEVLLKGERKDLKARIKESEALLKTLPPAVDPESYSRQKEEYNSRLDEFNKEDTVYSLYLQKVDSYNRMAAAVGKQQARLKELKAELEKYTDVKAPDTEVKAHIRKEYDQAGETIANNRAAYRSMKEGKEQLEKTLEALDKPVCPISPLITCHENKGPAKKEIEKSVQDMSESMKKLEDEIFKADKRRKELYAEAEKYAAEEKKYNGKVRIEREIKGLETSELKLPEKPAEVKKPDHKDAVADIRKQMSILEEKKKSFDTRAQLGKDQELLASYEALVKAVQDGGVVRKGVLSGYLGIFEDFCNDKCKSRDVPFKFMFGYDNGVIVKMTNRAGDLLDYASLSGGEKAFFLYMMISLLNDLCGARIILLDELSVMDAETFREFLSILTVCGEDYDNVFIASVSHPDTDEAVKASGIRITEINRQEKDIYEEQ